MLAGTWMAPGGARKYVLDDRNVKNKKKLEANLSKNINFPKKYRGVSKIDGPASDSQGPVDLGSLTIQWS